MEGASVVLDHRFGMPTYLYLLPLAAALVPVGVAAQTAATAAPVASPPTTSTPAEPAPLCPVGVLNCPKPKVSFAACKRNDLLDFYTPGLPAAGDRSAAPTDLVGRKVTQTDKTHERIEGEVEMSKLDALLKADVLT